MVKEPRCAACGQAIAGGQGYMRESGGKVIHVECPRPAESGEKAH